MDGDVKNKLRRPPVVTVMGHVDHGKSTLLDKIQQTNIVDGEFGGITQHLSSYEIEYDYSGEKRRITFIDTPGHMSFSFMRTVSATIADIAILIVSAEDGFKKQTEEAYEIIKEFNLPFVVAINKIDSPKADVQNTKNSLLEKGIYLEGMGGDIPFVEISALRGDNIDELLDMVLLIADMEDFSTDPSAPGEGFVLESFLDNKKGVISTFIIKDGSLKKGDYVVAGNRFASVRKLEDYSGRSVGELFASSPAKCFGFKDAPSPGDLFRVVPSKKEAEVLACSCDLVNEIHSCDTDGGDCDEDMLIVPIVVKADVVGTLNAVMGELESIRKPNARLRIVSSGVGKITDNDLMMAGISGDNVIIASFNVSADSKMRDALKKFRYGEFNVIYKLKEWVEEQIDDIREPKRVLEEVGKVKVLKVFSRKGDTVLLGGRVIDGSVDFANALAIEDSDGLRSDETMSILSMKQAGADVSRVEEGEFGFFVKTDKDISEGDILVSVAERRI